MINFKDDLNKDLNHITCIASSKELIAKAKPNRTSAYIIPRLAAAIFVFVLLAGICFIPNLFGKEENSFVIYAGAQELSDKYYVDLNSNDPNYIKFDFNQILDENSEPTDITKRYLFHSFEKKLDLKVEGKDIKCITYKINKGSLTAVILKTSDTKNSTLKFLNSCSDDSSIFTIKYDEQPSTTFSYNFAIPKDDFFQSSSVNNYSALAETGEIVRTTDLLKAPNSNTMKATADYDIIASGYKYNYTPLATEEEIENLRKLAKNNDMVGFYNYQNQVFKRIIDGTTIDITVEKNNGEKETKTLELCYTPTEITTADRTNENHSYTLSNGTLSSRLIEN